MKITTKIKRGILLLLITILSLVTFSSLNANAAVTSGNIKYHYNVYTKANWDLYQKGLSANPIIVMSDLKVNNAMSGDDVYTLLQEYENGNTGIFEECGLTEGFYVGSDLVKDGEDYKTSGLGASKKYSLLSGASLHTGSVADLYQLLKNEYPSKTLSDYPTLTSVQANQQIVIAVTGELQGSSANSFRSASVLLNVEQYAKDGLTTYPNQMLKDAGYTIPNQTVSGVGKVLGFTSPATSQNTPSPAFIGAIGLTVKNGVSSLTIEYLKTTGNAGENNFCEGVGTSTSASAAPTANPEKFSEDKLTLTVEGLSDDVELTALTVEGDSCLTNPAPTSVTVNGDSTYQYTGKDVSDGIANVTLTVKGGGKLLPNSVKYGTSIANATTTATSTSANGFTVNMSALSPGQSYYAIFQVQSSSGAATKWYAVKLNKAQDTNCDLSGVSFSGTDGVSSATISLSPNFSANTTAYNVYIPKGTTNLKIIPTFDDSLKTCMFYNPSTASSGTAVNPSGTATSISSWSNDMKVKVRVTAQAGGTHYKDYIFTLKEVALKPIDVTVTSGSFTDTDNDSDLNGEFVIDNLPFKSNQFGMSINFPNPGVIANVKLYQGNVLSNQDILGSSSCTFMVTANGNLAVTENFRLEVTSTSGLVQTYTIKVNRKAADTNKTLGNISITANNGSDNVICNSFSGTTLTVNYPGGATELPMTYGSFKVSATAASSLATVEIKINNNVTSTHTFSGATALAIPVSVKVTAEDGTSTTYTCNIKRAGANQDDGIDFSGLTYTYEDASGTLQNGTYTLGLSGSTYSNSDNLLPYLTKTACFIITPRVSTTKVFINGQDYTGREYRVDPVTFSASSQTVRVHIRVKTEYDLTVYPGGTSGGTEFDIDIQGQQPDSTRRITKLELLHTTTGAVISNSQNTTTSGLSYTFVLKQSLVGNQYRVDLTWESSTTEAYLSAVDDYKTQMIAANLYNSNTTFDIGKPLYLYLKSQDGNHTKYTLNVQFQDERSTECGIENVIIRDPEGNEIFNSFIESQASYPTTGTISVPFSVTSVEFEVTVKDAKETLSAGNHYISTAPGTNRKSTQTVNLIAGTTTYYVQGVAENTDLKGTVYSFKVERKVGGTNKLIESLSINGVDCMDDANLNTYFDYKFVNTSSDFSIFFPRGTNNLAAVFTVSPGATYTISASNAGGAGQSSTPFMFNATDGSVVELTIVVKSETETVTGSGAGRTYKIKVYVADTDKTLDDIKFYAAEDDYTDLLDINDNLFVFDPSTATQSTFEVPFKTKNVFLLPQKDGFNGKVAFNSNTLSSLSDGFNRPLTNPSTYSIQVKVTSELGDLAASDAKVKKDKTFTYTLTIVRKAGAKNANLDQLEMYIGGVLQQFTNQGTSQVFAPTNAGPYFVENVSTSASSGSITAVPQDPNAKVEGAGQQTITLSNGTTSQIFKIKVTAEDEVTTKEYTIQIWTTAANASDNKALNKLVATTTTNLTNNKLTPTFNQGTHLYNVNLSSTEEEVKLTFTKDHALSTIYYECGALNGSSTDIPFDLIVPVDPGASVTYKIWLTAQDGSSTENSDYYEVVITRDAADTDATLKTFTVNGKPVTGFAAGDNGGSYTVHIGDANECWLGGTTTKNTSQIISNPCDSNNKAVLNYGNNTFVLRTQAQDGKTELEYTVVVVKDYPKTLDDLQVNVDVNGVSTNLLTPDFSSSIFAGYSVTLEYDQKNATFVFNSQYAVDGDPYANRLSVFDDKNQEHTSPSNMVLITDIPVGTNVYKVRVKAISGATVDYPISITRKAGNDDNTIATFDYLAKSTDSTKTNLPITAGKDNYTYVVGRDVLKFNEDFIDITLSNPNAELVWPTNENLTAGQANNVQVIVRSQTGKERIYTFTVYPCDTDFDIDDINALENENQADILDKDGSTFIDYENQVLSITVPNKVSQTYLEVLGGGENSEIYVNGNKYTNKIVTLKEGTNTFVIYIKSEYGVKNPSATDAQSPSVTVTIIREKVNTDSTLKKLVVTYKDKDGVEHTIEHDGLPANSLLAIPNVGENISDIHIEAVPTDPQATVSGDGPQAVFDPDSAVENYTIECTAEDGVTKTKYPIKIARGPIDPSKDNQLTYIEVSDSTGTQHLGQATFQAGTTAYGPFTIPYAAQSYTITVVKPGYAESTVLIDNKTIASNTVNQTIIDTDRGQTKRIPVQVVAKDGTKGQEYIIELEFDAPSNNSQLSDLKADGVTVPGFSPSDKGGEYILPARPNTTDTIKIDFVKADPKSTVSGDVGTLNLKEGLNTFVVVVTPESGPASTYRIQVQRDYPLPYLTDLNVVGEQLLNEQDKATTFDKEVYTYHAIVPYTSLAATINASVDNTNYKVACSNSTVVTNEGLTRTFNVALPEEGTYNFTLTVTSDEGKSVEYILVIQRRPKSSMNTNVARIWIDEIVEFEKEYSNLVRDYAYTVPNKVKNLTVHVQCEKVADANGDGATYKIINAENLEVGKNTLVILVFAEDGVSTRAILVEVTREPMSFEIDENAYEGFATTKLDTNKYEIDLGDKTVAAIEDYTKYIVSDPEDKLEITILSDINDAKCNEVVVRISDGSEEQLVTFKLKTTANGGLSVPEFLQTIFPWILLGLAVIILILILICVNRDKYGSINKRRKKQED